MNTKNMTTKQRNQKKAKELTYMLALERLMDEEGFNEMEVAKAQMMMVIRELVIDYSDEDIAALRSKSPADLIAMAKKRGELSKEPKYLWTDGNPRRDHNGQFADYSATERTIEALLNTPDDDPTFQ